MVTIKDIGQVLGLSHATVSRALNGSPLVTDETRQSIERVARELGYRPDPAARTLRGSTSNLIGFVLPDIGNNFYSRIAGTVAQLAADRSMHLVLSITDDSPSREEHQIAELLRARARAVIITPSSGLTARSAEMLGQVRTIQMVRRHPALRADMVVADDQNAIAAATNHLAAQGRRRIAYIGGDASTLSTGRERLEGYLAAMAALDLPSEGLVELGPPPQRGFGRDASLRLLSRDPRPDGIVVGSSQFVTGLLEAIMVSGLAVPRDLAFTGYDDPDWFAFWGQGITTAVLPSEDIARAVTAFALDEDHTANALRIDGDAEEGRRVIFATRLAPRGT